MSDEMLAFLFALGIIVLWGVIRSVRKPKAAASVPTREPDKARAHALAVYGAEQLSRKGLADTMLRDYRFTTRVGSLDNASLPLLEQQLQSALMEMLTHLHLLPNIRLLVTDDPAKLSGPGRLGEYVHDYAKKEIRILVQKGYSAEVLLAGLCHECAHYFMFSHGLNESDPDYNEGLTDTMACLIGFGQTMLKEKSNRPLPYLNDAELQIVYQYLLEKRKELAEAKNRENALATARAQLRKNLAGAREMYRQAEAVLMVRKTPDTAKMSKSQLAVISETLLGMETKSFEQVFQSAEAAQSGDLMRVTRADDEVLAICSRLYSLLLLYKS